MSYLTTNDLRVLVLMLGGSPTLVNSSDTELLAMLQHELLYLVEKDKFKAFYESMPTDIAIRFFTDKRVVQFFIENAKAFSGKPKKPTLAERLERGVYSDIWLPPAALWSELNECLTDTQDAMMEAAKLLRKHGLGE